MGQVGRLLVLSLALLAAAGAPRAEDAEQQIRSKEGELQQIRRQIEDLRSELGSERQQRELLLGELQQVEREIGDLARRLRVLGGSLERQQERLEGLHQVRSVQQEDLELERLVLARQLRSAYAMGRQERIKILLNQQDPDVVSRLLVYYDYFNRERARRIANINQTLEAIRETEREIGAEELRLRELRARELAQQQELEASGARRREVVAVLNARIEEKGSELSGLQSDERQLRSLVKQLHEALASAPLDGAEVKPFKQQRGRLEWPAAGRLAARFGSAKGGGLKWDGVLIAAPEGREVKAVHHGRVAFADWLRGFGLMIIIDHGDGYLSLYGHNQSLFKETGEWVAPGEPIALVGNSGGQLNSGVYFGLRHKGRPVNPRTWCKKGRGNWVGSRPMVDKRVLALAAAPLREDRI